MSVKVHQALHGYSEGHRQLACSATLSSKDARLLLVMSDVSGPGVAGIGIPYLTGYPLTDSGLYALSMTWPAPEMPRPGCVWTHTLLISFADLAIMDVPSALAKLFTRPSQERLGGFESEVHVEFGSPFREPINPKGARYLGVLCSALYGHPEEQIWARRAVDVDVDDVVLRLWDQQWPRLRRSFKFCTLTTRDRSQDALQFDLQLTTSVSNSARLRLASTVEGFEATDVVHDTWLADLVQDAEHPTRSSLRQMLRLLGADVLGGREAMRHICMLHAALETPSLSALSAAITMVQIDLPLSTSNMAKAIVTKSVLDSKLPVVADGILDFALQHFGLLSDAEVIEQAPNLARVVWNADPRLFIVSSNEGSEKVRSALRERVLSIDREDVFAALPKLADLSEPLLQLIPELAMDQRFWEHTQSWPSRIASLGVEISSPEALRAMVEGLRDERAIDSALLFAGTQTVLACVNERVGTMSPVAELDRWIRHACNDLHGVASFLSQCTRPSQKLLLILGSVLPPEAVPNDYGDDPWAVALSNLNAAEGVLPVELCAYGFRRALSWRSRSVETLLRLTFEPLHVAATRQAIPVDSWSLLEGALPWVSSNEAWDSALRLRRAVAKRCVDLSLRPECFVELVASDRLFVELMEAVWELWSGRRYLRGVKDWLNDAGNGPHSLQRKIVKQFIKERPTFW